MPRVIPGPRRTGIRVPLSLALAAACLAGSPLAVLAARTSDQPSVVVRAVLFYSPTCPHCHEVMTQSLPPLQRKYGSQLEILAVDVTGPQGRALFDAAIEENALSPETMGVPAMFVADAVFIGSAEIPEKFPAKVEALRAKGGSDWPSWTGLEEKSDAGSLAYTPPSQPLAEALERAGRDPLASLMSIVVLLALLGTLAWSSAMARARSVARRRLTGWIALGGLAGLIVAAYLAIVEMTASSAVCGPVGDCNAVHTSEFARLFGWLPIGLLGCAGYTSILAGWLVDRTTGDPLAQVSRLAVLVLAMLGVAFSIYLTFLEPFVIGATCAWCLLSAVLMDAILIFAVSSIWPPRRRAIRSRAPRALRA
jgi:uncharacterized membrane protein/thiol-disulfide isomerase/thioredoxin